MLSSQQDGAARASLFSSVVWLVFGAASYLAASAKLVRPEFLSGRFLSYGRLSAVASVSIQYGWLALAGIGAIFYVLPRVTGSPMHSEKLGFLAVALMNLSVILGIAVNLGIGPQGHPFSELPNGLYVLLLVATLGVALNVVRTISSRSEPSLYVSAWFFAGAAIWAPLAIIFGRLVPLTGMADSIADLFGLNAVLNLWFGAVGIGALYYVIPRATGAALYSHRLALVGFWTLAFLGPM
ncbi:MAG: cbb3-type cytochrome c oxidase subunit I, partial [Actinomycetota bacterium]